MPLSDEVSISRRLSRHLEDLREVVSDNTAPPQDQRLLMEPMPTKESKVLSAREISHRTGILSIQGFTRCVFSWPLALSSGYKPTSTLS